MSMLKYLFLFFIFSFANADEWTHADTKREAVFIALDMVDWAQTRSISRSSDYCEKNRYLGDRPSVGRVDGWFASTLLAQVGVAYVLPEKYRRIFQYVSIGVEAGYVANNLSIGVHAKF